MTAPPSEIVESLGSSPPRAAGSNAPLLLDDPNTAWKVVGGRMDVFAVPVINGLVAGSREFLFHADKGDVLFGNVASESENIVLMAVGGSDSAVAPIAIDELHAFAAEHPASAVAIVEQYIRLVGTALSVRNVPRFDAIVDGVDPQTLGPGTALGARRNVVWLEVHDHSVWFASEKELTIGKGAAPVPLAPGSWLSIDEEAFVPARLLPFSTLELLENNALWPALRSFQQLVVAWAELTFVRDNELRLKQLHSRAAADVGIHREAIAAMASIMATGKTRADRKKGLPLLAAMEMVGAEMGITFRAPGAHIPVSEPYGAARAVAQNSSVGQRRVLLTPGWWKRDVGPLLGFLEMRMLMVTGASSSANDIELLPVALLPDSEGGYDLVNPETGSRSKMSEEFSSHLAGFGVQFYRALPSGKITIADLWRFATFGIRKDGRALIFASLAGSALGLLLPLLTAYLFDDVIPSADRSALMNVFVALAVATIAGAMFDFTSSIAVMRVHTRMGSALQMAVIDRLVRLPVTFFRKFSSGDLGQRAMGINSIGNYLGSATVSAVISSAVSASSFVLLVHYSPQLAMVAVAIVVINVAVSLVMGRMMMSYAREYQEASGKLSGLVLQLLEGIAKIRVAGTEARAFALWSNAFKREQQVGFRLGVFQNNAEVFNTVLSLVSTIALYWMYANMTGSGGTALTTGEFLAFSAAFGSFVAAALGLTGTAISLVQLIPTWERARPVLDELPEVNIMKPDPGELTGHIEVNQLNFSYAHDGPQILNDVSLEAKPGQFIALVGPSGSGKSTLLRILLGFEKPKSGSIRFDGHELTAVDVTAVRRQIGVVLQNSSLTSGDIYSNIVGASALTIDDAWVAARMAGMEEDLQAMPMGMHTVVSEGGGALSGGQRQRLLIARALVTRPRVLFFDEATSALDNRTQRIVSESIDSMHATRIVLAHRLSTIRRADCIYVMNAGRLVEKGTYEELMAKGGLFASMAARQEA